MIKFNYLCSPSVSMFVWLPSHEKQLLLPRPNPVGESLSPSPQSCLQPRLRLLCHSFCSFCYLAFWLSRPTLIMLMKTFVKQNPWESWKKALPKRLSFISLISIAPELLSVHGVTPEWACWAEKWFMNSDLKDKWFQTSLARLYNPNSGSENRRDKERGRCRCWNSNESFKKWKEKARQTASHPFKSSFCPEEAVWVTSTLGCLSLPLRRSREWRKT